METVKKMQFIREGIESKDQPSTKVNKPTMKQKLFDIILNWSREEQLKLPKVLYTVVCQYYGKGDLLIIFMDRLQIYNLISPNTINVNDPIHINQSSINSSSTPQNKSASTQPDSITNKFTFRCSVINREYNTNDILFIGGFDEKQGVAITDCQLYNINDNKFYALPRCSNPRSDARSVMYSKYECITLGGHQVEAIDSVELYSFKTNSWTSLPNLPRSNVYFAAASAQKIKKVFVAGGQDSYGVHNMLYVLQECEEDVDFEAVEEKKDEKVSKNESVFGLTEDEDIIAMEKEENKWTDGKWKWVQLKNMIKHNYWCDGDYWDRYDKFLVIGGIRRYKDIDSYDVYKDVWQRLPQSKYDHSNGVCSIWNGYIVWVGDDRKMCNIELFDRRMNKWISSEIPEELQPPYKRARIWTWL